MNQPNRALCGIADSDFTRAGFSAMIDYVTAHHPASADRRDGFNSGAPCQWPNQRKARPRLVAGGVGAGAVPGHGPVLG